MQATSKLEIREWLTCLKHLPELIFILAGTFACLLPIGLFAGAI